MNVNTESETTAASKSEIKSDPKASFAKDVTEPFSKVTDNIKIEVAEESKTVSDKEGNGSVRTTMCQPPGNKLYGKLLHPVAGIHAALLERRARRQALFGSCGPYKQAMSARRDLAIR